MKNNYQKKATKSKVAKIECVCFKETKATLQLNDNEWICDDCAQSISGHATDMGY